MYMCGMYGVWMRAPHLYFCHLEELNKRLPFGEKNSVVAPGNGCIEGDDWWPRAWKVINEKFMVLTTGQSLIQQ